MAGSPRPEPLLPQASAALALLRLRLVISVASAASVDPLPDLCLSLVLRQVSDLVLLLLRRVVLAGLATLPLLAPLRLRRLASGLAQHLFLPLGSVLPASLRLRS